MKCSSGSDRAASRSATTLRPVFHVIISVKIFGAPELEAGRYYVAPLAVFPFLIWGSLRFGQLGASLVTLVFSLVAVGGASYGTGPFMIGKSLPDLLTSKNWNTTSRSEPAIWWPSTPTCTRRWPNAVVWKSR